MKPFGTVLISLALTAVCLQQSDAQTRVAPTPSAATRAIYGKTVGHTYTNGLIGIKLLIPQGFEILEPHYVDVGLATNTPGSLFAGQNLTMKSVLSASLFPSSISCTVVKLPAKMAKLTGEQILNDPLFRSANEPKAKGDRLGNSTIAYVDSTTKYGGKDRSYALVKNGYYILIVVRHKDADDLDTFRDYLARSDFAWTGK